MNVESLDASRLTDYSELMKVAAYQAPLLPLGSMHARDLMQARVRECEADGISVLCCPEAILGGLADYSANPAQLALRSDNGQLDSVLAPLASDSVTSIVGFSELASDGALYNAAAIFQRGKVMGLYRKIHPAIRRSVYAPGSKIPVFRAGRLTFGVVICNDSNYPELARLITAQGATVLFVPTNNSLPNERACPKLNAAASKADATLALESRIWVTRADVAGSNDGLTCYGASEIVNPSGNVVRQGLLLRSGTLVQEIEG